MVIFVNAGAIHLRCSIGLSGGHGEEKFQKATRLTTCAGIVLARTSNILNVYQDTNTQSKQIRNDIHISIPKLLRSGRRHSALPQN
jgi:hypothetical protein